MTLRPRIALAAMPLAMRRCRQRTAGEPLKVGFVYVSPIGDAGLDVPARHRPQGNGKGARRQGRRPSTSKACPEGADAERVIRELAQAGNKLIFTTSFGYMNPTLKVAKHVPEDRLRACDRLQDAKQRRHLQRALLRRPLSRGHRRGQDDQVERRRLRRRVSDSRSRHGHQRVRARHAQRQSEGRGEGRLGQLVVRSRARARSGRIR